MSDFEREIVRTLNSFFSEQSIPGFAYRLKQARFNSQYVDLIADSLDPRYYLAIECKSIKSKKLYFSQHFHYDKNGVHQVDLISVFLEKTGRRGYLAVEFRGGAGRPNEAYLLPWHRVRDMYLSESGISKEEFRDGISLARVSQKYVLESI